MVGYKRCVVLSSIALLIGWSAWLHYQLRTMLVPTTPVDTVAAKRVDSAAPSFTTAAPAATTPVPTSRLQGDDATGGLGCPKDCHAVAGTELPGDVVRWGADHKVESASQCCAACKSRVGCNTWVWCGNATACASRHQECWLKKRPDPFEDIDLLTGRSSLWTSGVLGEPPVAATGAVDMSADGGGGLGPEASMDFALLTVEGLVRFRLRPQATNAVQYARALLDEVRASPSQQTSAPDVDAERPVRDGLRFYRAEPVPGRWGSLDWPDNYLGGRWGPPYALLQGSLRPRGTRVRPSSADRGPGAKPIIRRGMVAWAGGQGGPDFFIALAQHPEWGNGHTVWADCLDMGVIDAIMRRPLRVSNWGSINATELITPVPFHLLTPETAKRVLGGGVQ